MTKKRRAAWYKLFSIVMVLSLLAGMVVPVAPAVAYAEGEDAFLVPDLTRGVDDPLLDSPGSPLESTAEDDAEQMAEDDTVYDEGASDESASEDDPQEDTVADAVSDEKASEENTSEDDTEEDTVTNTVYGEATPERTSMGVGILSEGPTVTVTGNGVENPQTFDLSEFIDEHPDAWVDARVYSTINTWPSKKWYVAEGVKVAALLEEADIKDEAQLIKVKASDGYVMAFTRKELLEDTRYYFPNFKEEGVDGDGHIPGSPEGAEPVDAILALQSVEGSDNPGYMNPLNCPLLVLGQRGVTEQTNHTFVKKVAEIEVSCDFPLKHVKPTADPSGGEVPVGTEVTLTNQRNDDDKIYYTTDGSDPNVWDSLIYNWVASRWWSQRGEEAVAEINHPIVLTEDTTIKAKTIGFGREDSDIVTFEYTVYTVDVIGVSIDEDDQELKEGETVQLTAIVEPEDATDKSVTWSSSNEDVATVDETGLVTAVAEGEAEITVTTNDGNYTDSITVTVVSVPVVFTVEINGEEVEAYTMADLKAMPATTRAYGATGCYVRTGVDFIYLLEYLDIDYQNWTVKLKMTDAPSGYPLNFSTLIDPLLAYEESTGGSDFIPFLPLILYHGDGSNHKLAYQNVVGINVIKPVLNPPALVADSTDNTVGNPIELTFTDDEEWRNAVNDVTVNDNAIASDDYTLEAGKLTIDASVFTAAGEYTIMVKATGYEDATVTQILTTSDFVVQDGVLVEYKGAGGDVVIPGDLGITTIGSMAFAELGNLTSVVIPEGVTTIQGIAFEGCPNLNTVVLPESVNKIGACAFAECPKLTQINIPEAVTSIEKETFYRCSALTSITLPSGITSIGEAAFQQCYNLSDINIPDAVTSIGENAFRRCEALTEIVIPGNVTSIGDSAFIRCDNLSSLTILSTETAFGSGVFTDCPNVTIYGYSSSTAEAYATANGIPFVALDGEDIPLTIVVKEDGTEIRTVSYNMADWETAQQRYSARDSMPAYRLGAAEGVFLEDLLEDADIDISKITGFKFVSTDDYAMPISKSELLDVPRYYYPNIFEADQEEGAEPVKPMLALKSYVGARGSSEPPSWDMIDDQNTIRLFAGQKTPEDINYGLFAKWICEIEVELETADVPVTGVNISEGDQELYEGETVQLTAVVEPDNATDKSVTWSSSNETVATVSETGLVTAVAEGTEEITVTTNDGGFTDSITVTVVPVSDFVVVDGVLVEYKGAGGDVVIPGDLGITEIGFEAFRENGTLTSVIIPEGVTLINKNAFRKCTNLAMVDLPDSLLKIGDSAFYQCYSLTEVTLPENLEWLSYATFDFCESLQSLTFLSVDVFINSPIAFILPPSLTIYGYSGSTAEAYANSKGIPFIALDAKPHIVSVTPVGDVQVPIGTVEADAIVALASETTITDSDDETHTVALDWTIAEYDGNTPGDYTATGTFELPEGVKQSDPPLELKVTATVTVLAQAKYAVTLTVDPVESGSASGAGEYAEGDSVTVEAQAAEGYAFVNWTGAEGEVSTNASYTFTMPAADVSLTANFEPVSDFVVVDGVLVEYKGAGGDVVIPGDLGITEIGFEAFRENGTLTSVIIPEGVTLINKNAFRKCTNLAMVDLPDSLLKIGDSAFYQCYSLTEVTLPENLEWLSYATFDFCESLQSLTFLSVDVFINSPIAFILPPSLTIYGYSGSTAEAYANSKDIPFEVLDAKPHIVSITPVDDVQVPYGTAEGDAIAALASGTTITDSDGVTHNVFLTWTIEDYDGNTPGAYTATGTFELPEGVEQSDPAMELKVTATVTVAQGYNMLNVEAEPADIPIGDSFTVSVNVENISDVQGYEVTLKYDPAYAEYKSYQVPFKPDSMALKVIEEGKITVANFVLGDAPWEQDSGALVEVEFESRYPGTIEGGVYDFTFEEIEVVLEPKDSSDPAVREKLDSPIVKYYEGSDVDIYAALELREDHGGITSNLQNGSDYEVTTGSDGSATFEMVRPGEYSLTLEADGYLKAVVEGVVVTFGEENQVGTALNPVLLYAGDVNGDGKICIMDIALAANEYGQAGDPGWVIEDLNLDGKVNISDLAAIARNFDLTTADTTYNYKDEAPYWE